jgi:hypothetical protein
MWLEVRYGSDFALRYPAAGRDAAGDGIET